MVLVMVMIVVIVVMVVMVVIVVILKNHFDDGGNVDGNENRCTTLKSHDGDVVVY